MPKLPAQNHMQMLMGNRYQMLKPFTLFSDQLCHSADQHSPQSLNLKEAFRRKSRGTPLRRPGFPSAPPMGAIWPKPQKSHTQWIKIHVVVLFPFNLHQPMFYNSLDSH